jgi:hypothetical protein
MVVWEPSKELLEKKKDSAFKRIFSGPNFFWM